MAWKQVQNPTILANLNDNVELPREVYALDISDNGDTTGWFLVPITKWEDGNGNVVTHARTDTEAEFMYYGSIRGYAHKVYCSVVIGDSNINPESKFPTDVKDVTDEDKPDEFGIPKSEVRTADMPNIDDYQYFKSKKNRTTWESAQLQKLTEMLANKIIMAKDINTLRNAINNTQAFCLSLLQELNKSVTDGENIGDGEGEVYAGLKDNNEIGKTMEFRTLKAGEGININTNGDEIEFSSGFSSDFCNKDPIQARSYDTCSLYWEGNGEDLSKGAYVRLGSPFVGIKTRKAGKTGDANSLFFVFGQGDGFDKEMINAGRMFKGKRDLIIEMKTGSNQYSGIQILGNHNNEKSGKVVIYENDSRSHIQLAIEKDQVDIDLETGHAIENYDGVDDKDVFGKDSACGNIK